MSKAADEGDAAIGLLSLTDTDQLTSEAVSDVVGHDIDEADFESAPTEDEATIDPTIVWTVVPVCLIGVFVANADTSLVFASSQNVASEFDALESASWLVTSYVLGQCAAQPLYGKLSTIFGRKNNLVWCYGFFAVGCLVCSVGGKYWQVIAGRFISGIGGAGMTALVSVIIADLVPVRKIAAWRSFSNIAATMGRSMGGPIGGLLTDTVGWRWSFLGQVPLTILSLILVLWRLPSYQTPSKSSERDVTLGQKLKRIDLAGSVTLASTISGFLLILDFVTRSYPPYVTLVTIVATVSLGGGFYFVERYVALEPVVPLKLVTKRPAWTSYLLVGFQQAAQTGIFYATPIYFQIAMGTTVTQAGLHMVPSVIGNAVGGLISGWTISRMARYQGLTVLASVVATVGYTLITVRWAGSTNWFEAMYICLGGFGMGVITSTSFVHLAAYFRDDDLAIAGTMLYSVQNIFQAVGVQSCTAVIQTSLSRILEMDLEGVPDKHKIIAQATSNVGSISSLPIALKTIVVQAYITSLRFAFGASILLAIVGLLLGLSIKEGRIK